MSDAFLDACGANGPVHLELEGGPGTEPDRRDLSWPSLLIGRHPRADVVLDHDDVSRRHAYLQVVGGRAFCVDLGSRTGTTAEGGGASGWLRPDRGVRIGPYRLRVRVDAATEAGDGPDLGYDPSPLSSRYARSHRLPGAALEIRDGRADALLQPLSRVVTLIGRSPLCALRLLDAQASRFFGAFVRTPVGVWFVDLRPTDAVRVNGEPAHGRRLAEGDELQVGRYTMRMTYACDAQRHDAERRDDPASPSSALALSASDRRTDLWTAIPARAEPEGDLQPLLHQVVQLQQQMCDQFQQTMLMISQLFGSMHHDHIAVVREELEQIRHLTQEIQGLRAAPLPPQTAAGAFPAHNAPPPAPVEAPVDHRPRPDPWEAHAMVSEQLAAFERERTTRWNRIVRLLTAATE